MDVVKIHVKERLIGDPCLFATVDHSVRLEGGSFVKAGDFVPGDRAVFPVPLLPGLDQEHSFTVLRVEFIETQAKKSGLGWFKNDSIPT